MLTKAAQIDLLISNANPLYHRTAVNTVHRQTKTFISMAKTLKAFQPHASLILPLSPSLPLVWSPCLADIFIISMH